VDALIHASVIPEPFGQVVVEGMAAGLAVVAADEGGPAETITNEFDGLLVPVGDVNALAEVLQRLSLDKELRERLGGNALITAKKYRPEVIAAQMLEIYELLTVTKVAKDKASDSEVKLDSCVEWAGPNAESSLN
jgi:glycosyltransferase involved in cell wall biosynthesis